MDRMRAYEKRLVEMGVVDALPTFLAHFRVCACLFIVRRLAEVETKRRDP